MRWRCDCSYDGSGYSGWQIQNGPASVQQTLEEALSEIFKRPITIIGSGRTDTGVHARAQVFHFDADWRHGSARLLKAMSSKLPSDIRILNASEADPEFHARFSAKEKLYVYQLFLGAADPFKWRYCWSVPERLNLNLVAEAMREIEGTHDFAALAANRGQAYESTVRTIHEARVTQDADFVYFSFRADGFMYKMVRTLVGTLVNVGLDRIPPGEVRRFFETRKRTPMAFVAPARGLFLERVFYA